MLDHSSLTNIWQQLPKEMTEQVFSFVLTMTFEKKLLNGNSIDIDATMLEANTAMRLILIRDSGGT